MSGLERFEEGQNMDHPFESPFPEPELLKIRTLKEYEEFQKKVLSRRVTIELKMTEGNRDKSFWFVDGYCQWCENEVHYLIDWQYSDGKVPNFRERMVCNVCGLNNRQRFMAAYLRRRVDRDGKAINRIYLYEQTTNFYARVCQRLKKVGVIGSEYFGYEKKPGDVINGVRHEDALNLSFGDQSFDMVVANDVYEHVPDIRKALGEASRVLKENGELVFSVPFYPLKKKTQKRAFLRKEKIISSLREQYHANPVSVKGSLVFYDFGWDLFSFCKEAGFKDAYVLAYYSLWYGYMGKGLQFIFVAEK